MKKLTLIALMALVMLGFTQCKKETSAEANMVDITFTATRGDAKTSISPLGEVQFVPGDKIHVYGASSGYHGYLTYTSGAKGSAATFSGSITQWNNNENLRFIFMGAYNDSRMDSEGAVTVCFDDQTYEGTQSPANDLANIANKFHISRCMIENVAQTTTEFSGELENIMALAVFNTSAFNDGTNVKFYDTHTDVDGNSHANAFKTRLAISSIGGLSYYNAGISTNTGNYQSGYILTGPGQTKRYVALLPRNLDGENVSEFKFTSNNMVSTSNVPVTFSRNKFIHDGNFEGITVTAAPVTSNYVDLALASNYTFEVSSTKTVRFAKGNLVYDEGRFKMHSQQYGRVFNQVYLSSPGLKDYIRVYGTFDYFRWGTSGWNNGNTNYAPYACAHNSSVQYGPMDGNGNYLSFTETDGNKADWGTYQFGMNASNVAWRTLTSDEWVWLLGPESNPMPGTNCRESATVNHVQNARYAKAMVDNIPGMFIFPDNYTHPRTVHDIVGINDPGSHWNNADPNENNVFTLAEWTEMERAGMIFLPVCNYCSHSYSNNTAMQSTAFTTGAYWSSTYYEVSGSNNYAFALTFNSGNNHNVKPRNNYVCYTGMNVRLVVDAN